MKNKSKRPKYSKNERKKYFSIWGLNNSLSLLKSKKYNVLKIVLLKNSIAWKSKQIQDFYNNNKKLFVIVNKDIFINKYDEYRTQGIVVEFDGELISELPNLSNSKGNICLLLFKISNHP